MAHWLRTHPCPPLDRNLPAGAALWQGCTLLSFLPPISKSFTVLLVDIPTCHLVVRGQGECSILSQVIECGLCPQSNEEPWRVLAEVMHAHFYALKDH